MSDGNEVSTTEPVVIDVSQDDASDLGMLGWSNDLNINRALTIILLTREIAKQTDPNLQQFLGVAATNLMIPMSPPRGQLVAIKGGKEDK
jgi:hypothetical protein